MWYVEKGRRECCISRKRIGDLPEAMDLAKLFPYVDDLAKALREFTEDSTRKSYVLKSDGGEFWTMPSAYETVMHMLREAARMELERNRRNVEQKIREL